MDQQALRQVYRRTDVLSANAREARIASGLTDLDAAAEWFVGHLRPGGFAVIRDGANGCWFADLPCASPAPLVSTA